MNFMTVVLPALNEERHLERCVRSLLNDKWPRDRLEIFVVDGGSSDRTVEIARELQGEFPFLKILHNPKKLQAPGFNMALAAADPRSEYVVRCDVHCDYPDDFLSKAAAALDRSGASVATYGDAPKGEGCFQRAVAFAQNTPIGVGNAYYRLGNISKFVEHGKHGCFRRRDVERVGGYDENFSHNEDSELSLRLHHAGGKVWLDASLTVGYYPRATPKALLRQYWLYGRGRAMTVLKHRLVPRARQMAPVALLFAEAVWLLAAPWFPWMLGFFGLYAASLMAVGAYGALKQRSLCVLAAPLALAIMHHAWGAGFIARIAAGPVPGTGPRQPAVAPQPARY